MTTFNTFEHRPSTVEALRYDAPSEDGTGGNAEQIQALAGDGVEILRQDPWAPPVQACLVLWFEDGSGQTALLKPGDYLVKTPSGRLSTTDGQAFEAKYDTTATAPAAADETAKASASSADGAQDPASK